MQRFFPTWTKPCVAVFSNHLPDWNLWFFRVTFLGWVLNFVGGSLWDLPLCLKLGSQIVPQPGPTKVEKKAGPPHGSSAVFFGRKPNQQSSWFQKSFSQLNTQMSQPLLKMKGPPEPLQNPPKMQKRSNFFPQPLVDGFSKLWLLGVETLVPAGLVSVPVVGPMLGPCSCPKSSFGKV